MDITPSRIRAAREALLNDPDALRHFDGLMQHHFEVEPLADFIPRTSPHLIQARHLKIITDIIEQARRERIKVCISLPPRHGKTVTLLHAFAWWLKHWPADTCAYYTYSDTKGRTKSRIARMIARQEGIELDNSSTDLSGWRTKQQGGLLAGGAGGGLTGEGVSGVFLVDDPYPNRQKADSPVYREMIWDWFWEVAMTRSEGASYVVIHTRWHEDDLIGRLSEDPDWLVVNLPALCDDPETDLLGRKEDEALWPNRTNCTWQELDKYRSKNAWSFAALYQGRPRPKGGACFDEPARYDLRKFKLTGHRACIAVDPATTAKTQADFSAIVTLAMKHFGVHTKAFITDVRRLQVGTPQLVRILGDMQKRKRLYLVVEAVGGFKAVPQMLREANPNLAIHEVHPTVDKFVRAQPLATAWNSERVAVPIEADWDIDAYLQEFRRFTGLGDKHDDQVDATSHGWNALYRDNPSQRMGSRIGVELPFA